jgi:(2Fe-2S) ferredoxin
MRYKHHIFVCENVREPGHKRGCCSEKGSVELRARLKAIVKERGLKGSVRVNRAGCLDACEFGPSAVVYPEGIWYGHLTEDDLDEIVTEHLESDRPVERLRIRHPRFSPDLFEEQS